MPRLRSILETHFIQPVSREETLQLAQKWTAGLNTGGKAPLVSPETLEEAFQAIEDAINDTSEPIEFQYTRRLFIEHMFWKWIDLLI